MNKWFVILGIVVVIMGTMVPKVGLITYSPSLSQPQVSANNVVEFTVPYSLVQNANYSRNIPVYRFYSALGYSVTNTTIVDYSMNPPLTITPQMFTNGWILGAGGTYCAQCIDWEKPVLYVLGVAILIVGLAYRHRTQQELNAERLPYYQSEYR